jgi:hypothetical protein
LSKLLSASFSGYLSEHLVSYSNLELKTMSRFVSSVEFRMCKSQTYNFLTASTTANVNGEALSTLLLIRDIEKALLLDRSEIEALCE